MKCFANLGLKLALFSICSSVYWQTWSVHVPAATSLFVCLLQDASGHSNVLKAGKAEELKNARKRRTAKLVSDL